MATQTTFSAYTATLANVLSTELDSLANGSATAAGTAYDNTTNLDLWADFVLDVTFASNPTAGSTIDLYLIPSVDGTNYADSAVLPASYLVGSFVLRAVSTAQKVALLRVPLLPGKAKFAAVNNSGQAFPASGSTVKLRTYHVTNT